MKIIFIIKINIKLKENVIKLLYKSINNLFYFDNIEKNAIVCINKDFEIRNF